MFGILTAIDNYKRKFISGLTRLRHREKIGQGLACYGWPLFIFQKGADVKIGRNVTFISKSKYNMVGIYKNCTVFAGENARLIIGDGSGFSGVSIYCSREIVIGSHVNCGGNVAIWDTDFHPLDHIGRRMHDVKKIAAKKVIIEDDVFIGGNTIVMKGVTIGKRSVIGAGSVVTKNIPPDEIWAGNPARFIRRIDSD